MTERANTNKITLNEQEDRTIYTTILNPDNYFEGLDDERPDSVLGAKTSNVKTLRMSKEDLYYED